MEDEEIMEYECEMTKWLFSDEYSDVFRDILGTMGVDDDEIRDTIIDSFEETVTEALEDKR